MASNLLTVQHLAQINDALKQLEEAQREIALAKRAGLHNGPQGVALADYEKQISESMDKLKSIKTVYFPNG